MAIRNPSKTEEFMIRHLEHVSVDWAGLQSLSHL